MKNGRFTQTLKNKKPKNSKKDSKLDGKKLNVSEDLSSPTLPSDVKKRVWLTFNLKGDWELCRQARKGTGFPVVPGHLWINSANAGQFTYVYKCCYPSHKSKLLFEPGENKFYLFKGMAKFSLSSSSE